MFEGSSPEPVRGDQEVHRGTDHQDLLQPRADGEGEDLSRQAQHYSRQAARVISVLLRIRRLVITLDPDPRKISDPAVQFSSQIGKYLMSNIKMLNLRVLGHSPEGSGTKCKA